MQRNTTIVDLTYDRIVRDYPDQEAVLFLFGGKEVWLPRALIEIDHDSETVELPQWKVEQEGLEAYVQVPF